MLLENGSAYAGPHDVKKRDEQSGSLDDALEALRRGRMVVLTDDEDRENEGDLVLAAEFVTPEAIAFMLREARGYLCLSLTEADCDRLDLQPQAATNSSVRGTAFTVSIDLHPKHGGTTGVSAAERARCIRLAIDPATTAGDFVRPGHVNPLRSRDGGVLVRTGQTEGSLDLCRLAGVRPAAVIIEIMRDDGEMARRADLEAFCARHGLVMCSVRQIIGHRLARESLVRRLEPREGTPIETQAGRFTLIAYESLVDPLPHVVLTVGGVGGLDARGVSVRREHPVLVRMHRRNLLGDVFLERGPSGVASADQLHAAMRCVQRAGEGAIVYLRTPTHGDGLEQRLQELRGPGGTRDHDSPALHAQNAVPRHMREYGIGGQVLRDLGLTRLKLITASTADLPGLDAFGLEIVERVGADG